MPPPRAAGSLATLFGVPLDARRGILTNPLARVKRPVEERAKHRDYPVGRYVAVLLAQPMVQVDDVLAGDALQQTVLPVLQVKVTRPPHTLARSGRVLGMRLQPSSAIVLDHVIDR